MARLVLFALVMPLLLGASGCLRPLQTDSRVAFTRPVAIRLNAELEPKNNNPLTEMTVEADQARGGAGHGGGPKVALVDVDGLLVNQNLTGPYSSGENPVDLFRERLDAAAADPDVCALVLRVNSPGGSVTATDVMWHELQTFRARTRRPVLACLMDHGCGGAYYLATACDLIVAHPTTVTGGIGVLLNLFNLQDALGVFNIVSQSIKAGKHIDMGSVLETLPVESKRLLEQMADEFHQRFRDIILRQRPGVDARDGTTFDGRVFTARQALQRRLIDRVGYLADAIALARELAGQPAARVVVLHRSNDVARTPYTITPNTPLQGSLFPVSIPGVERSRLPTFLYLWQIDPTLERLGGH
jgi:protease-4